jgi:Flp pilus assembly pilin Flp
MALEVNMHQLLRSVWREEEGQDLIEYTLLISFVVFITAGVMSIGGNSIKGIVNTSNSQIAEGNRIAAGS